MNLTIPEDAIAPQDFCIVFELFYLPANLFQSDPGSRLSTGVFTQIPPNPYSVVYDHHLLVSGQIVTSGIAVTWPPDVVLQAPLSLCIPLDNNIEISSIFSEFQLGFVETDNDGRAIYKFSPPMVATVQEHDNQTWLCGKITTQGAIYFFFNMCYPPKIFLPFSVSLSTVLLTLFRYLHWVEGQRHKRRVGLAVS